MSEWKRCITLEVSNKFFFLIFGCKTTVSFEKILEYIKGNTPN